MRDQDDQFEFDDFFGDELPDDICRNNHGGNPESEDANLSTDKDRDRGRIVQQLDLTGLAGATCDQLEAALGMSHQTCSARCSELLRDGIAIRKWDQVHPFRYERRPTRTGCHAAVLVLRKNAYDN
jgi:hypothetical protein